METIGRLKSAFERVEAEGMAALDGVQADVMSFLDRIKQHLTENPEPLFAVLRDIKPVLVVKNTALVTRFEDVQEVLSRDDVFQVTYKEKMEIVGGGGNFFLGMQNSQEEVSNATSRICGRSCEGRISLGRSRRSWPRWRKAS